MYDPNDREGAEVDCPEEETTMYDPNDREGAEVDCPDCGGEAIMTDDGIYCPDCANE